MIGNILAKFEKKSIERIFFKGMTLSLVHTSEISTSTNARHTQAQNQSYTNQTISARVKTWHLCLCLCEPDYSSQTFCIDICLATKAFVPIYVRTSTEVSDFSPLPPLPSN